mgnify:FL=1
MRVNPERLSEVLRYEPETGYFFWKAYKAGIQHGKRAGSVDRRGAVAIRLDGKRYAAHHLAWLHTHGKWPEHEIDHVNGNPGDNRIDNLRDVPHRINQQNFRASFVTNRSSGILGVSLHKKTGLWRARITANGNEISLGYFKDMEVARAAYIDAKRQYHDGCTI